MAATDEQTQTKGAEDTQQGYYTPVRDQSDIDSSFIQQIAGGSGVEGTAQAWQAYFDLAEHTLRTARRVSEMQVLSLMKQQIVADVTRQVVSEIKRNPSLLSAR